MDFVHGQCTGPNLDYYMGYEWAVGAEVTTEARDCFMQRK